MALSFFRNFAGVKADQVVQRGIEALVAWDPIGASNADLIGMEKSLSDLALQVTQARTAYEHAQAEADQLEDSQHTSLAAAKILQDKIAASTDAAEQARLTASLTTLVTQLEKTTPDIESHLADAKQAKEWFDQISDAFAAASEKIRTAKADFDRAQRAMAQSELQRRSAEQHAETAKQQAGLISSTSNITTALSAMNTITQRNRDAAAAASLEATALTPRHITEDPEIAKAMAEAAGTPPAPTSLSDRLAALQKSA
jgi:chromosome segregation ATPase